MGCRARSLFSGYSLRDDGRQRLSDYFIMITECYKEYGVRGRECPCSWNCCRVTPALQFRGAAWQYSRIQAATGLSNDLNPGSDQNQGLPASHVQSAVWMARVFPIDGFSAAVLWIAVANLRLFSNPIGNSMPGNSSVQSDRLPFTIASPILKAPVPPTRIDRLAAMPLRRRAAGRTRRQLPVPPVREPRAVPVVLSRVHPDRYRSCRAPV
jgi:hypothetical protein